MSGDHSSAALVRRKKKNEQEGGAGLPIGSSRGHHLLAVSCAAAAKVAGRKTCHPPLRPVASTDLKKNVESPSAAGEEFKREGEGGWHKQTAYIKCDHFFISRWLGFYQRKSSRNCS